MKVLKLSYQSLGCKKGKKIDFTACFWVYINFQLWKEEKRKKKGGNPSKVEMHLVHMSFVYKFQPSSWVSF